MSEGSPIRELWEAATMNWDDPATELRDSSVAYPGEPIRGKDLYRIGVALGFIEEVSMTDLAYPIKLDDAYPCRGVDALGEEQTFDDLLKEGMEVGPKVGEDVFPTGVVVRRQDGLWAVADGGGDGA